MKKIISSFAAAAVIATAGVASDVNFDTDQAYLIAGGAIEMVDGADMGLALVVGGGVPFMQAGEGTLVAEGELTYSLMAPTIEGTDVDFNVMTLGAYVGWKYDLDGGMFVKPRVGLTYSSWDWDVPGFYGGSVSYSEISLGAGVQGGMTLSDQMDVVVGLNLPKLGDIMHLTAGIQYRF